MTRFAYVARDREGRSVQGTCEAGTEALAVADLRGQGLLTLEVRPLEAARAERPRAGFAFLKPRAQDVELEMRQLAFMLRSGLSLLQALRICSQQSSRRAMARTWEGVSRDIQAGQGFAAALANHGGFNTLTRSLVEVGERTGLLEPVLTRAADAMQRRRQSKTAVATALAYPFIVLLLAIATVAYLLVGVIPKLTSFLRSLGRALPAPTQLLIDVSTFVRVHFLDFLIVFTVLAIAFTLVWRSASGRSFLDRCMLEVPLLGRVSRLATTTAFAFNMALLLRSGVRLTEGLQVVQPVLPNRRLGERVGRARQQVLQGSGLSEALTRERAFDPLVTGMIAVGESSGTLDEVLEDVAVHHEERLQDLIRRLGTIVEPVILIVIGAIVGFVYLAFFLAIYSVAGGRF